MIVDMLTLVLVIILMFLTFFFVGFAWIGWMAWGISGRREDLFVLIWCSSLVITLIYVNFNLL